ncbi:uncharacterized protein LY89DRAFT_756223 [Mollisia scopiformis]|uniref:Uncharacterized protein n=1 Tax=Mollisia scopiformis TaxID=149040 RepID=A0A194WYC6_MOLSC|nr:uncharacterized protein LY89DRAFT_756223 [Mollisia scopiformis]KUJ12968.1 hypothetical protein LY89DRAFT_756223 [Mollisia scopiformis]
MTQCCLQCGVVLWPNLHSPYTIREQEILAQKYPYCDQYHHALWAQRQAPYAYCKLPGTPISRSEPAAEGIKKPEEKRHRVQKGVKENEGTDGRKGKEHKPQAPKPKEQPKKNATPSQGGKHRKNKEPESEQQANKGAVPTQRNEANKKAAAESKQRQNDGNKPEDKLKGAIKQQVEFKLDRRDEGNKKATAAQQNAKAEEMKGKAHLEKKKVENGRPVPGTQTKIAAAEKAAEKARRLHSEVEKFTK